MTTLLLIRHALHELGPGRLAGRMPGVRLSPDGRQQAERLAERLAGAPVQAIYSSPMERARETAGPAAARLGLQVHVREALGEIDFGDWTGMTLDELEPLPEWRRWNAFRSGSRAPNGESMQEVHARMVSFIQQLCREHPDERIALFSHGDPIKAATAYYLGVSLDLFQRIDISTASVTTIAIGDWGPVVLGMNDTGALPRTTRA